MRHQLGSELAPILAMSKSLNSNTRFYWVDWARFLAAFAVLLTHARASTWVNWGNLAAEAKTIGAFSLYVISRFGHEAVIIFFVLSGYLVGGKLIERVRVGSFDVTRYAIDRTTRIYVPYVPALILSGIVWWVAGHGFSLKDFALNLAQLQQVAGPSFAGNDALWSLAYEVWFYVVGGAFALACTGSPGARTPALIVGVAGLALFVKLLPIYLLCWLIGAIAYAAAESTRSIRYGLFGAALFVGGVILSQYAFQTVSADYIATVGSDAKATPLRQIAFLVMCLGCALLLNATAGGTPRGIWARIEAWGVPLAAGSYTLYLTHYPVLCLCEKLDPVKHAAVDPASLASFGIRIAAAGIVAYVMYRLFESRTGQARRWILGCIGHQPK